MHTRQDPYTNRWVVYRAPFTPLIHAGKMMAFETKAEALLFIAEWRQ